MGQPAKYRQHARVCQAHAESAESEHERELLVELAQHWDGLAEAVERLLDAPSRSPANS